MKLRFNEGAIVEFTVIGFCKTTITGKVVDVLEDEVIICMQAHIEKKQKPVLWGEKKEWFEELYTADTDQIIHLNRQMIVSWRYIKATELMTARVVTSGSLNYYDKETGYCKGKGKYFGNVEEY